MNRILKKLVPGVLAAALALGAVPSGITFDDIKTSADPAPAEDQRMIYAMGGSIGTQINAKIYFHVPANDTEVAAIRIHDPDDGVYQDVTSGSTDPNVYVTYTKDQWVHYGADADYNYVVTIPVYPKNMKRQISFEMLNSSGTPIKYYQEGAPESSKTTTKKFTVIDYLQGVKDKVGDDPSTDLDKATWDLCTALTNYGDWASAYFYNRDDPTVHPKDGRYVEYNHSTSQKLDDTKDGIDPSTGKAYHPNYPTWWSDPSSYWKRTMRLDGKSLNTKLSEFAVYSMVNYQVDTDDEDAVNSVTGDNGFPYKQKHQPTIQLVLDDTVKLLVRVSGCANTTATVSFDGGEKKLLTVFKVKPPVKYDQNGNEIVETHAGQKQYNCYVFSDPLAFNQLNITHEFYLSGVCPDFPCRDKVTVSAMSYAKIVNNKRATDNTYEKNGLANTLRALVTVAAAAGNYDAALAASQQTPT